jgi:hypothetical protein
MACEQVRGRQDCEIRGRVSVCFGFLSSKRVDQGIDYISVANSPKRRSGVVDVRQNKLLYLILVESVGRVLISKAVNFLSRFP